MEYCTPVWNPWYIGDINLVENVQKRAITMISGLQGSYETKLNLLGLTTLYDRRIRQDMIQTYKMLYNHDRVNPSIWFTTQDNQEHRTRQSSFDKNLVWRD